MTCAVVRDGMEVLALTHACPRARHCLRLVRAENEGHLSS
jgi:hypothetical protein